MALTRIYTVGETSHASAVRLVRATTPAQALRHVAQDTFSVAVASQSDLVSALSDGIKVEDAGAEEPQATTTEPNPL